MSKSGKVAVPLLQLLDAVAAGQKFTADELGEWSEKIALAMCGTVYLVDFSDYDEYGILGVFFDEGEAEEHAEWLRKQYEERNPGHGPSIGVAQLTPGWKSGAWVASYGPPHRDGEPRILSSYFSLYEELEPKVYYEHFMGTADGMASQEEAEAAAKEAYERNQ